jgi:DUF438 domain-containing protein
MNDEEHLARVLAESQEDIVYDGYQRMSTDELELFRGISNYNEGSLSNLLVMVSGEIKKIGICHYTIKSPTNHVFFQ